MKTLEVGKEYQTKGYGKVIVVKKHEMDDYYIVQPVRNTSYFCEDAGDWYPYTDLETQYTLSGNGKFGYAPNCRCVIF